MTTVYNSESLTRDTGGQRTIYAMDHGHQHRGPGQRAGLRPGAVIAAARSLVEREGLAALTMRRLGRGAGRADGPDPTPAARPRRADPAGVVPSTAGNKRDPPGRGHPPAARPRRHPRPAGGASAPGAADLLVRVRRPPSAVAHRAAAGPAPRALPGRAGGRAAGVPQRRTPGGSASLLRLPFAKAAPATDHLGDPGRGGIGTGGR